jgi:hypothetical protein
MDYMRVGTFVQTSHDEFWVKNREFLYKLGAHFCWEIVGKVGGMTRDDIIRLTALSSCAG